MKKSSKILTLCLSISFMSNTFAQGPTISKKDKAKVVEAFLYSHFEGEKEMGAVFALIGVVLGGEGATTFIRAKQRINNLQTILEKELVPGKGITVREFYQEFVLAKKQFQTRIESISQQYKARSQLIKKFNIEVIKGSYSPSSELQNEFSRLKNNILNEAKTLSASSKPNNFAWTNLQAEVLKLADFLKGELPLAQELSDLNKSCQTYIDESRVVIDNFIEYVQKFKSNYHQSFVAMEAFSDLRVDYLDAVGMDGELAELSKAFEKYKIRGAIEEQDLLRVQKNAGLRMAGGAVMIALGGWMVYHEYQSRVASENDSLGFNETLEQLHFIHQNRSSVEFSEAISKLQNNYLDALFDMSLIHYLAYEGKLTT